MMAGNILDLQDDQSVQKGPCFDKSKHRTVLKGLMDVAVVLTISIYTHNQGSRFSLF